MEWAEYQRQIKQHPPEARQLAETWIPTLYVVWSLLKDETGIDSDIKQIVSDIEADFTEIYPGWKPAESMGIVPIAIAATPYAIPALAALTVAAAAAFAAQPKSRRALRDGIRRIIDTLKKAKKRLQRKAKRPTPKGPSGKGPIGAGIGRALTKVALAGALMTATMSGAGQEFIKSAGKALESTAEGVRDTPSAIKDIVKFSVVGVIVYFITTAMSKK
jgi:predicted small secreted protein